MFKKLIYQVIQKLKKLYTLLDEVYKEVYAEVEKEFNDRVRQLKEKNKRQFINKVSAIVKMKCLNETGFVMPDILAEKFAQDMYKEAKQCGDLDILNKLKERK